jgi:iron complex outermembrane receptor protein
MHSVASTTYRSRAARALGAAALLGAATPGAAQTPVTERLVVTATVAPVASDLLSRTLTVLTRDDLERMGATTVTDALRLVPGVDARARGAFEVQTDFSIRGATFGQNLVLADGLRLNNSQSGHHNGEIPAAVASVDRIEVVRGAASAVHGADALGGTINVISRRGPYRSGRIAVGQFGYASGQAAVSGGLVPANWTAALWATRAGNFDVPVDGGGRARSVDREFGLGGGSLRGAPAPGWTVDVRHQRRAFGANGFYGASPSKEWTDQTLAAVSRQAATGVWTWSARGVYRHHGDHFRWDINRPGFAENRHRTNAAEATLTATRRVRADHQVTLGLTAGGDWIRSSNLGRHRYARVSGFAELVAPLSAGTTVIAGLRTDAYSRFGSTASPSISAVRSVTPTVRLRGSVGHAFRIPSFTELYYTDPANLGSPDLRAERGWSVDGGADWTPAGWTFSGSVFRRWDQDVIDWVRETPADLWRSTNVRDVTSTGLELQASRMWGAAALRVSYAALDVDAPSLVLLSKYVLEYARHQTGVMVSGPIGAGLRGALTLDHRSRIDGQEYVLGAMRVSWGIPVGDVFVDVRNLFDARYREIPGVDLPGRWVTAGLSLR